MSKSKPTPSRPNTIPPDTTQLLPVSPELAALFDAHGVKRGSPVKEPDEFCVHEYADWRGIGDGTASNEMLSAVRSGRMTRRLFRRAYLYRFADGRKP